MSSVCSQAARISEASGISSLVAPYLTSFATHQDGEVTYPDRSRQWPISFAFVKESEDASESGAWQPKDGAIGRLAIRPTSSSERLHTYGFGNLVCDLGAAEARDVHLLTCPIALYPPTVEPRRSSAQDAIGR